jgi:nitrate reductase gamma subunit
MTLLEFARGPALEGSIIIFFVGILIRLFGAALMLRNKVLSKPRKNDWVRGGFRTILTRMVPAPVFEKRVRFQHYTGYIWHIGFFVTILFFQLHILFFKGLFGISWPGLPNGVIMVTGAVTTAVLVEVLFRRMFHPVLRAISTVDDYISLLVTMAPVITGMMAYAHLGPRYETMLAIHILSVAVLLVWFPFGKLMHMFLVFPSRYQQGAKFERRGVRA